MKKTSQLKQLILSNKLEFLMEAHNGLSAKIVEETGFKGIWASGLSLSASLGVRDNNEASWTQILDVLEFMSDASEIPILLDGDTGYGNFNNMRRLVKKLEQREIAGVCIEDKLFPKTNSFIGGENQPLADIDEFSGKIKAAKDSQKDDNFIVVARLEAFIAGWGLQEALRRAEAYRLAGADAILCHSKKSDASDVQAFMKEWGNRHPVVIVPTKYYKTPTEVFRELKINLIIWANHNLRASIKAIQQTAQNIFQNEHLQEIENEIVSVNEIFRLQGAEELQKAEGKYLPQKPKVSAIVLAASQGNLGELTKEIPKTLLKIKGKSILQNQIQLYNQVGIKDICVLRGFKKEKINFSNIQSIDNQQFESTKELYSLYLAKEKIKENTVVSYGDIIFKNYILNDLLNDKNDITLIVDAEASKGIDIDYVCNSKAYRKDLFLEQIWFKKMAYKMSENQIHGEFIGLWKVNEKGAKIVKETLEILAQKKDFKQMTCTNLFNEIAKKHKIAIKYIKGDWIDIDTFVDLEKADAVL